MGHHDHQAALREEGEGLEEDLLGLLVEVGARLVEEHDRASGEHDAGERDAGPLAGGQAGTVLAERRLQAVGEGAYDVGEADAAQGLPHLVVAGRGAADPHVGADGVGQQPRSLRCPPDQAAPPARVEVGERGAAEPDVAGHGRQLAAERRQERRLAAAGRPGDGDQAPFGQLEVERTGQGSAGGVADLEVAQHEPGRGGQRRAGLDQAGPRQEAVGVGEGGGALGCRVELRAHAAQRPVGLGGEQQDGEGDLEADAPRREPQAHRHRHQRDGQGGDQLQHRRGGEGDLEGVDGRAAVAVRDGPDRGDLRLGAAVGDEGRQPAHHVEEVPRERLERAPLRAGAVAGREPDQHREDRDQRQRQRDHQARERVEPGDRGERDEGEDDGRHERGEVARDVGLDAGDAAGGQHDEAGGRQVVAAACGVQEPLPQRPGDLARRTGRRPLADVRRTGPQQHQTGERPRGTRPAAGRRR